MLIDGCRLMVVLISFCSQREAELGDHLSALGLQDQGMIIVTTILLKDNYYDHNGDNHHMIHNDNKDNYHL